MADFFLPTQAFGSASSFTNTPPNVLSWRTGFLQLVEADWTTTELPPAPRPSWEKFFFETPGDGQGELLVSLQLIHVKGGDLGDFRELPQPASIIPKTRPVRT